MLSQLFAQNPRLRLMADSLAIARSQVGIREIPRDSNRGPEVEIYQAAVGIDPGKPYSAALVWWCVEKAWRAMNGGWDENEGAPPVPLLRTGWSHAMWRWLEHRGQTYTVEDVLNGQAIPPGALFFLHGPVSWGAGQDVRHVGFTSGVDVLDLSMFTVEGNTNKAGSLEGEGVWRLERGLGSVKAFGIYGVERIIR